ncbi:hypothetical protein PSENEW3n2_00005380 [Picochlorum sp. SENEW3]|nr:hypothetical protein PSENEW3n2_00005380 [Picochlorum sp. SENEW3]WPT17375.1 hypothetical protein PSENEW3_00005380 [Picochlorum sp. SENEW3]
MKPEKKPKRHRQQKKEAKKPLRYISSLSIAVAVLTALGSLVLGRYTGGISKRGMYNVKNTFASLRYQWQRWQEKLVGYSLSLEGEDGYFPESCMWRISPDDDSPHDTSSSKKKLAEGSSPLWRVRTYEFWDEDGGRWTKERPVACTIEHALLSSRGPESAWTNNLTTNILDYGEYRVMKNVWFTRGDFYRLVEQPITKSPFKISSNIDMYALVVNNTECFKENVNVTYIKGDVALVDFSYFTHPTAIGHWLEYLLPMMSARRIAGRLQSPCAVIIMHMKRSFIFEWVRAALGAAFGLKKGTHLPPIIFQEEVGSYWNQIGMNFEGVSGDEWLCFENIIAMKDVIQNGTTTAFGTEAQRDAHLFRERMYSMYGKTLKPLPPVDTNRNITLLHKSSNRRITNREDLKKMLSSYGIVSEVELTSNVTVSAQLDIMARTHILVSSHTSGLANAMFLRPGALVIELVQRNWLISLENTFLRQTQTLGDVRHVRWKATRLHEGVYIDPDDERLFGGELWDGENCNVEECVEAHTLVDIVVNLTEVESLLNANL